MKALLFYLVLLTTFFAIPYSNLFFLGIAFLSVVALCNLAWAHANLRGLYASVGELKPCAAGSAIQVPIVVRGRSGRRRSALIGLVELEAARGRTHGVDSTDAETTLGVDLPPLTRGIHRIVRASIESTYPYGLIRARCDATVAAELVVYPAPVSLAAERRSSRRALVAALLPEARREGDVGVAYVRDWRTGDDLRRVHWKATARRGELVVREFDDDDGSGSEIVLDRRCSAEELEAALSLVATLALAAAERKEGLTLHTQGSSAAYGTSAASTHALLRLLATLQPLDHDDVAPPPAATSALRLPKRGRR
ncbi:MAG: DUF58 domain-containing protein [Planctomycetota bacterium]